MSPASSKIPPKGASYATIATVRDALVETFARLDSWCALSAEHLLHRPSYPDAWNVAEHLEHVSLVNHFLLLTIRKGTGTALRRSQSQLIPAGESGLESLAPIADPDSFPWEPPRHMIPVGTKNPAEVQELLNLQLGECMGLLERMREGEGMLCSFNMSVYNLGRLDMYQWLYFLAQHGRWHLAFLAKRESATVLPSGG
jgi:hypothetical protein